MSAVDRLESKMRMGGSRLLSLTKILIPAYERLKDGHVQHVDAYWRTLRPGEDPGGKQTAPDHAFDVGKGGKLIPKAQTPAGGAVQKVVSKGNAPLPDATPSQPALAPVSKASVSAMMKKHYVARGGWTSSGKVAGWGSHHAGYLHDAELHLPIPGIDYNLEAMMPEYWNRPGQKRYYTVGHPGEHGYKIYRQEGTKYQSKKYPSHQPPINLRSVEVRGKPTGRVIIGYQGSTSINASPEAEAKQFAVHSKHFAEMIAAENLQYRELSREEAAHLATEDVPHPIGIIEGRKPKPPKAVTAVTKPEPSAVQKVVDIQARSDASISLESHVGGSNKFWTSSVAGSTVTTRYGKIGTPGQEQTFDFGSPTEAHAYFAKKQNEKLTKGYVQAQPSSLPAPVAAEPAAASLKEKLAPVQVGVSAPKAANFTSWEDLPIGRELSIFSDAVDENYKVPMKYQGIDAQGRVKLSRISVPKASTLKRNYSLGPDEIQGAYAYGLHRYADARLIGQVLQRAGFGANSYSGTMVKGYGYNSGGYKISTFNDGWEVEYKGKPGPEQPAMQKALEDFGFNVKTNDYGRLDVRTPPDEKMPWDENNGFDPRKEPQPPKPVDVTEPTPAIATLKEKLSPKENYDVTSVGVEPKAGGQHSSVITVTKSKDDLKALAESHGIAVGEDWTKVDIMDALREKLGVFDPAMEIDPAKAQDLNHRIHWDKPGHEFDDIKDYLNDKWVLEPKFDGARFRLFLGKKGNSAKTGRRSSATFQYTDRADNFPHLRDTVVPELAGTVIDGEIMPPTDKIEIAPGNFTQGTLNAVMSLVNINPTDAIARQKKHGKAVFVMFDVTSVNGEDVTKLPLTDRRKMLEQIAEVLTARDPAFQLAPQFDANEANIRASLDAGMEGVMLKKKDSTYKPGARLNTWQKVKRMSTGDFYIIGSVPGKGSNIGKVGSLKVAYRGANGEDVYVADVAGFNEAMRAMITDPLTGQVKPEFMGRVIEVMGQGRTKGNRIRHPHFVRWRDDKAPEETDKAQFELFEPI